MTVIQFKPFMAVAFEESGTGKPIEALVVEPTAATSRRLADHRLVFRPQGNGFRLFAQVNPEAGNTRLAAVGSRTSFIFGLRLTEPDFLAHYFPDFTAATGPNLYLSNLNANGSPRASGALSRGDTVDKADAARIVGRRHRARIDLTTARSPATVRIADRYKSGRTVAAVPVTAARDSTVARVALDLSADPACAFTLAGQPGGRPRTVLFADDELAARGAFGVLELVAQPLRDREPAAGRQYTATFRRRS